jgi:hypothetical protein
VFPAVLKPLRCRAVQVPPVLLAKLVIGEPKDPPGLPVPTVLRVPLVPLEKLVLRVPLALRAPLAQMDL